MPRIDESRPFVPVRIAVLTVSDTRTVKDDKSGDLLVSRAREAGHEIAGQAIAPDDVEKIREQVMGWIRNEGVDVVLTTGGTGFTGRDVTPEAIRPLFDKEIDGFSVVFHRVSFEKVGTSTIQSRACAGLIKETYVFCLPGSPGACRDGWDEILKWQLDNRHRPCNFVEIMPRLAER